MNGQNIKYFFTRFRKVLIASFLCVLAIAVVCVVAVKTAQNSSLGQREEDNVQVSTPTAITFIMPIKEGEIIKDFSATALKYNKTLKQWEAHKAVCIKGTDNAEVLACYGGTVTDVQTDYLKGTIVTITHNSTLKTEYSSLDNVTVSVGDTVKQGDVIGYASTSAKAESAEGDHVHLEVLQDGKKVDPQLYLITGDK